MSEEEKLKMDIDKLTELEASIKKEEALHIYKFLKEKGIRRTLEVGMASGRSTAYIISATGSEHVAIDPFQKEYFNNSGIENLRKLGLLKYLVFMQEFSHNALPELLKQNKKFDFILIDGGHKFDDQFIDFYFSDLLLEKSGYIFFHDTWMRSTQMMLSYIKSNRKDYKFGKVLKNLVMFQKVGDDKRNWKFHKEFFSLEPVSIVKGILSRWYVKV